MKKKSFQKKKNSKKFTELTIPSTTKRDKDEVEIPYIPKIKISFDETENGYTTPPITPTKHIDTLKLRESPSGSPMPSNSPNFLSYLNYMDVIHLNEDTEGEISEEEEKDNKKNKNQTDYEKVYNFIFIPFEVEKFLFFGLILCLDSFLYYFTYFPLRLISTFFFVIFSKFKLRNSQIIDFTKFLLIVINCIIMFSLLDYSKSYHWVRGESALKLYVFYNLLEVMERLCCSFGEDIQSALHNTILQRKSFHIFFLFIINIIYLCNKKFNLNLNFFFERYSFYC